MDGDRVSHAWGYAARRGGGLIDDASPEGAWGTWRGAVQGAMGGCYTAGTPAPEARMPHTKTKQVLNRLARVEGHIRSIRGMVADDRPCPDVLIQMAAARSALEQAARVLLEDHLEHCIVEAKTRGDVASAVAELKAALNRFIA
jgi:DNA-binding FrmR family transcriptional regulator